MKKLTRFYSNPEYALNCIEDKELTLIKANKLNDPMDCIYGTTATIPAFEEIKKWYWENKQQFDEDPNNSQNAKGMQKIL